MQAKTSYREAAVRGASPVQLVICLYEQAIEDLRRAIIAQEKGAIEVRTSQINHALMVLGQLQGTLDKQRGGEVALHLERFYSVVRAGLIDAQLKQSTRILEQQILQLAIVHEAWLEVERAMVASTPQSAESAPRQPETPSLGTPSANWNA
jgi:flagellar secretion chaperone FliS